MRTVDDHTKPPFPHSWWAQPVLRVVALLALLVGMRGPLVADDGNNTRPDDAAKAAADRDGAPDRELFRGRVVLLREALKARDITAFEEMKDQVVLETPDGELIPIIADWRGRAFFQDKRLRDRKVELIGTRRPGVPYLQVLVIYTFDENDVRQYTDYWCDICSIPMYEIKPCDCCQDSTRLRFQPQELPDYIEVDGRR